MRQRFNERIESTQVILKSVLERSDRFVYRCDPTVHKEGNLNDLFFLLNKFNK